MGEDRPAARLLDGSHQVIFNLIALQRRRQKLVDIDYAIRRTVCDTKLQDDPVSHIQHGEQNQQRYYELAKSTLPVPHQAHPE